MKHSFFTSLLILLLTSCNNEEQEIAKLSDKFIAANQTGDTTLFVSLMVTEDRQRWRTDPQTQLIVRFGVMKFHKLTFDSSTLYSQDSAAMHFSMSPNTQVPGTTSRQIVVKENGEWRIRYY